MKRPKKWQIIFISIVIFLSIGNNHIRLPAVFIKLIQFIIIPTGTSKEEVYRYIYAKDFQVISDANIPYGRKVGKTMTSVGDSFIRVVLGEYQGIPFRVSANMIMIFDENNNLLKIIVKKETNGL